MPVPSNRAVIQIARGDYANLLAAQADFEEGELSYAKDENLLYIKENGVLTRLEYVTTADLAAAVTASIALEIQGGDGIDAVYDPNFQPAGRTTVSLDQAFVKNLTGVSDTKNPHGLVDKTLTVIAYRPTEQEFWFYPTGSDASFWSQGNKFTFSTYKSVAEPTSSGLYYLYLDTNGDLQIKTTEFDYKADVPICQFYWNQTQGSPTLLVDRRHGASMDWSTLEYLDSSLNPVVKSGFAISGIAVAPDGTSDDHAKFQLADGTTLFHDVKIEVEHNASPASNVASNEFQQVLQPAAQIPVLYLDGTEWNLATSTDYALSLDTGVPVYNTYTANWGTSQVSDDHYFVSYIVSTGNTEYPIVAVMGQDQYSTSAQAEGERLSDLDLGDLANVPLKTLYKIIYKHDASYTNAVKSVIDSYQDLRAEGGLGGTITDHGRLNGLTDDDHLQYMHVSIDRTITASHEIQGTLSVTNSTTSTTAATGAMTVTGGVGVQGNLSVGGDVNAVLDGGNF